jgi:hypothetical protein
VTKEAVVAALAELEDSTGRLTAEAVVEAAADEASPLYTYFQWDDNQAAHQYRLHQARKLIRSVEVVLRVSRRTITAIGYIRDPSVDGREQGYRATREIARDDNDSHEALAYAFSSAAAHLRRARDLAKVFRKEREFDDLLQSLNLLRSSLGEPADRRPEA